MGFTTFFEDGDSNTEFHAPGGGILRRPTLHAMYIHPPKPTGPQSTFYLEVESFLAQSFSGAGGTVFAMGVQPGYLPGGPGKSANLGASAALLSSSGDTQLALGPAVGYRVPVQTHFAVRLQAGYRRWFDAELDELTFAVILGAVFGG